MVHWPLIYNSGCVLVRMPNITMLDFYRGLLWLNRSIYGKNKTGSGCDQILLGSQEVSLCATLAGLLESYSGDVQ